MKFLFDQSADFRLIPHLRELGRDVIARNYGFEKIEEIWQTHRRKELEKQGYLKCYVCNIHKSGPIALYLQKTYRIFWITESDVDGQNPTFFLIPLR